MSDTSRIPNEMPTPFAFSRADSRHPLFPAQVVQGPGDLGRPPTPPHAVKLLDLAFDRNWFSWHTFPANGWLSETPLAADPAWQKPPSRGNLAKRSITQ